MASRSASRTVVCTISVPAGMSGSAAASAFGAAGTGASFWRRLVLASRALPPASPEPARSAGFAAAGASPWRRRLGLADIAGALAVLQQHGDRRVDLDAFGAGGDQDLAERAFIDGFDFHRRLVGLDLGDDVAGGDLVAFVLQPFGEIALLHRRRERGHQDFDRHVSRLPQCTMSVQSSDASGSGSVWANSAASATMSRTSLSIALSSSSLAHFLSMQPRLDLLDRVVLGAHLLHFVLRAVLRRVGHGVAAIAVGLHLEDDRPLARAAPFGGDIGGRLHGAHVHAVDLQAGNAEGQAALREIGLGRGARHRGAHGVAVVLDDVDDRQLPQRGHVEALVDLALVGRAVAEIGRARHCCCSR